MWQRIKHHITVSRRFRKSLEDVRNKHVLNVRKTRKQEVEYSNPDKEVMKSMRRDYRWTKKAEDDA
jgi:hypothetical protein